LLQDVIHLGLQENIHLLPWLFRVWGQVPGSRSGWGAAPGAETSPGQAKIFCLQYYFEQVRNYV
jgi:hypothetical protein